MPLFTTPTYLLPALLLNPVLLLHTLNTILSRLLPAVPTSFPGTAPSLPIWGPSAINPPINMHAHDNLCWSYTVVMVGVQLMAFGRVNDAREASKSRDRERREKEAMREMNGDANGTNGELKSDSGSGEEEMA